MLSAAHEKEINRRIDASFDDTVAAVRKYLGIPGFSHSGEGIRESAQYTWALLEAAGAQDSELVETGGHPVVFGRLRSRRPKAKTVILYSHYDMVPLMDESQWVGPPLEAPVVDASAIGAPAHLGKVLIGRASNDYRGPLLTTLRTFEIMRDVTGDLPINVVFAIDGEEEIGAPNIHTFIKMKQEDLAAADALWMPGMHQDTGGVMQVYRGYKGNSKIEIEIKGGRWGGTVDAKESWSANVPWMDAPMFRMIRLLSTLVDENDLATLDGLEDLTAPYTDEDKEQIATFRERLDPARLKAQLRIERFKRDQDPRDLAENFIMKTIINVVGIVGGYTGPRVYSTLPMKVVAKLECRFVPNLTYADVQRLFRAHLDRHGFPEAELRFLGGYEPARSSAREDIYQAAFRACKKHHCDFLVWPIKPAGAPFSHFNHPPLSKPLIFVGMGHGDRWHQPNEYITVDGIRDNMKYAVTFLDEWAG